MEAILETGGERLQIISALPWVDELIDEAAAGALQHGDSEAATVIVRVEATNRAFDIASWEPLTRSAWRLREEVVMEDVCSSGFDLRLRCTPDDVEFTFRYRPRLRGHAAAQLLRTRFTLLTRAVLIQYPALWRASLRGRAPLHASACTVGDLRPLLAGPGGVGKSTLMAQELAAGGQAISDNLCVSDGVTVWGVVEPMRIEGGSGRSMPHGRGELPLAGRISSLTPNVLVVLRRGHDEVAYLRFCGTSSVARSLITGTYMAGELRRYWGFAATLTAGTEMGPSHPPVEAIARQLASRLPSVEIVLPRQPGVRLAELLSLMEAIA
ncbi:MAG TPA: hypothetical protein VLR46_13455 [Candidatus Dormibacteraeota bacterium]|nr:hypothetical protein [Candidatus Dormibacteraeota bacterium]